MGLASYAGGGGKTFLPGDDVTDGMGAKLLEQPVIAEKDFGNGPEQAPTFIMEVAALQSKDNEDAVFEWTPGKFAVGFLLEHLGAQEADWEYPVEGHFERRTVKTKYGKKKALHFIPEGIKESAASGPKEGSRTSERESPTRSQTGARSSARQDFVADGIHFPTAADMEAYLRKVRKSKR